MLLRIAVIGLAAAGSIGAGGAPEWKLTPGPDFELYSQASAARTADLFQWLEQLRAFFLSQSIIPLDGLPSARIVIFATPWDYEPYRARALSNGYYAASDQRHYIALVAGSGQRRNAAHEFTHLALDASGLKLPEWLGEGLAEFFSTVQINAHASELGAPRLEHLRTLRNRPWMPLSGILSVDRDSAIWDDRSSSNLFYAESWALAHMLLLMPGYAPRFQNFLDDMRSGIPVPQAFDDAFHKSVADVDSDLHTWIGSGTGKSMHLTGVSVQALASGAYAVSSFTARSVLADMLAAAGALDRSEALLSELAREAPNRADISVALGEIALRKGDNVTARREWKRAMSQGATDADVFYRYALLADQSGLPAAEIRSALQRAIALRPDFDDAHYRLALLEKNAGNYPEAVAQLRAMRIVAPPRAFSYWSVLSDALNELGRRDESLAAAQKAARYAGTPDEKALAAHLAYFSQTDLTVQLARDASGREQMVTARVPHQSAADWNPFVEPGDDLRTVRGLLRELDCNAVTEIRIDAEGSVLTLAIPDPSRVRMRNAPPEFVCGPQDSRPVEVQYAASPERAYDGLVRGIEFLR